MSTVPEGWYADPASSTHQRYWTGTSWTEHLKANDPPEPAQPITTAAVADAPTADPFAAYATNYDNAQSFPTEPRNARSNGFQFGGVELNATVYGRSFNATNATVGRVGSIRNAVFGFAIAALFLIAGNLMLNLFASASTAPEGSTSAVGNIISLDDSSLSSDLCKPHVEYVVAGETHTVISPLATDPCPWVLGQAVTVAYFPDDIDGTAVIVDDSNTILYLRLAVNVMGGLALVASVVSLVRRR